MSIVQNEEFILVPNNTSRTTTFTSNDLPNLSGRSGLSVILNTSNIGTATLLITINGKDIASGQYYNILTGASVTTNSTNRYKVSPSIAAVANAIAQDELPPTFQIVATIGGTGAAIYSLSYSLVRA